MKQSKYERGRYQFSLPHTHNYFQVDSSQFVFYFLPQEILVDYFQVHFQTYFQAFTLKDPSDWKQQAFNLYNFSYGGCPVPTQRIALFIKTHLTNFTNLYFPGGCPADREVEWERYSGKFHPSNGSIFKNIKKRA